MLNLGFLTVLFSNAVINGYATGVAIHAISSQISAILGYRVKSYKGVLNLIYVSTYDHIMNCTFKTYKNLDEHQNVIISSVMC